MAPHIAALIASRPTASEDEIGWAAVEQLSIDAGAAADAGVRGASRAKRPAVDPDRSAAGA